MRTLRMRGYSPISTSAALSVAVLIIVFGMQLGNMFKTEEPAIVADLAPVEPRAYLQIDDADGNGTPDWQDELAKNGIVFSTTTAVTAKASDPISNIAADVAEALYGGYISLKQYGEYTPARGEQLAGSVAASIRAPSVFLPHTVDELTLKSDTSSESVLAYRAEMRDATEPLLSDEAPELDLFASYLQTKDVSWLTRLMAAASRYGDAERRMLKVTVPKDAAPEHLRATNAVGAYASIVGRLSQSDANALAAAALIKTQSEAEEELLMSFDALAKYYVRKTAN